MCRIKNKNTILNNNKNKNKEITNKSQIVILIPAYNPNKKLVELIDDLNTNSYNNIIVVNDGSSIKNKKYFEKIENRVTIILHHSVNLGKGRALKTGLNYFLLQEEKFQGVITVDADGQHSIKDIDKIANKINKENIILRRKEF